MAKKLFIPIEGLDDSKLMQGARRAMDRLKDIFKEGFASIKDYATIDVSDALTFSDDFKNSAKQYIEDQKRQLDLLDEQKQKLVEYETEQKKLLETTESKMSDLSGDVRDADNALAASADRIRQINTLIDTAGPDAVMKSVGKLSDALAAAEADYQQKLNERNQAVARVSGTAEYQELQKTTEQIQLNIQHANEEYEKQKSLIQDNIQKNSTAFEQAAQSEGLSAEQAAELNNQLSNATLNADDMDTYLVQNNQEFEQSNQELQQMDGESNKVGQSTKLFGQFIYESKEAMEAANQAFAQAHPILNGIVNLLTLIPKATFGILRGGVELLGKGVQKAGGLFKKLFSNVTKGAKQGGMSIKRMMMAMLGARSLFTVISKATHAYMATNEELNEKLQGIWNSLGELLGPVIEYLINLIVKLFGYVNSFVQALTGINMVATANAKALKKQAEAQKGLNAQTAAFDEMNKLSDGGGDAAPQLQVPDFTVDVGGVGKDIASKFNEFVDSIDWEELGKRISDGLKYAMDQAIDLLEGIEWQKLGQYMAELISAIDWTGVTERIFRIFGDILGGLAGFIWGMMKNSWESVKEYFAGYIQKAQEEFPNNMFGLAGDIISGLFNGILDALSNLWNWIKEHIFKPFIEGFNEAFKMGSPSKVMEEEGHFIIEGLYNGLLGIWDAVKGIFENLVLNILRKLTDILFGEDNFLTDSLESWDSFKEMLSQTVDNIKTSIITKWDAIKTSIQDKWNSIKQGAVDAWNAIKNTFSPVVNWFREKFSGAWNAVKSIFSDKGDVFKGIQEGISTTFKNIVNKLIDGINKVVSWPFSKINNMLNNIKSVSILGIKPFDSLWGWSPISVPSIPRLAQGAVIPPNKEFMAILGDQKSGMNIEAPLDTIVDAFRQVLAENNGQALELTVKLDGKTLSRELTKATKKLDFSYNRG